MAMFELRLIVIAVIVIPAIFVFSLLMLILVEQD
jgi:hypothetical protein